jgi:uncharacterized protein (DUF983 family)
MALITTGIKRGLMHRCPHCGQGKLFRKYLKVQPTCEACGHDNAQYPADDGPAYFTILIVGHLVIVPLLAMKFIIEWPWQSVLALTVPLVLLLTLLLLPRIKGGVIGLQWAIREDYKIAHGHDPVPPAT